MNPDDTEKPEDTQAHGPESELEGEPEGGSDLVPVKDQTRDPLDTSEEGSLESTASEEPDIEDQIEQASDPQSVADVHSVDDELTDPDEIPNATDSSGSPIDFKDLNEDRLVQELEYNTSATAQPTDDDAPPAVFESVAQARAVMEGLLFSSNDPVTEPRLSKLMNNLHPRTVRGLLLELQMDYDRRGGALQIVEIAGGFQMCTRPHLADWMFRMHKHKRRSALSPATLETLAIVAYKQPVTKGDIENIRGVESSGTMRTLQDLNLVESKARKEVPGRPQLYSTTEQFLKVFGLRNLGDMSSISELKQQFLDRPLHNVPPQPPKAISGEEVTSPEYDEENDMQDDNQDQIDAFNELDTQEDNVEIVESEMKEDIDQSSISQPTPDPQAIDNVAEETEVAQTGQDDQTMPPDAHGR